MASHYTYPGQYEYQGVTYSNWIIKDVLDKFRTDLTFDAEDVVLATFPKSGTTWMTQILYSVNVGPDKAKDRTESLSDLMYFPEMIAEGTPQYDLFTAAPPPRIMTTHLNVSFYERFLKGNPGHCPKFIIVARDPKATLVSYYHFHRMLPMGFEDKSWDEFFEVFREKRLAYGDPIDYNVGWWKYRDHPNVLFIHYEDMLNDSVTAIHQVANFIGRSLSDDEVSEVAHQSSFEQMRKKGLASFVKDSEVFKEIISPFFRSGKKGDWRNNFSDEQSKYVDSYVKLHSEILGLHYKD